jgi:hypothetical protein
MTTVAELVLLFRSQGATKTDAPCASRPQPFPKLDFAVNAGLTNSYSCCHTRCERRQAPRLILQPT